MISFSALQSYNPLLNLFIGIAYFLGVAQLGNLLLKLFLGNFPNPFRKVLAVLLGFLSMSALMTLLSICFWINSWTMHTSNAIIFSLFLLTLYQQTPIYYDYIKNYKFNYDTITLFTGVIVILAILPILYYALLPTSKIDEIHYHMPPIQYIILDGGYTYPEHYLRNPSIMIYSMAQIPIVYLGFPDAFNVISMLFWFVILYFSNQILIKFDLVIRLLIASILLAGLYAIIQTTPSSTVFSTLSTLLLVVLYGEREIIIKNSSLNSFSWAWAITANAAAIGKLSLVILAALLSLFLVYDIIRNKKLSWKVFFAFLLPTMLFYMPTLIWIYTHVGTFWGHILAEYFPYHKFSKEELQIPKQALASLNDVTITFIKYNFINFSFIKLSAIVLLFFSNLNKKIKIELFIICLLTAICFQYLGNAFELRYWGSIDSAFLILALLYAPDSWKIQIKKQKNQLAVIAIGIFPYLCVMYYYVANLNPIPFFSETAKEKFCSKFIPYYADYQALNNILPTNAVIYFPEVNINIVGAPRKLYIYAKDIHQDTALYIITSSLAKQAIYHSIAGKKYEKGKKVYENQKSVVRTYRTPNLKPAIAVLEVHKLKETE